MLTSKATRRSSVLIGAVGLAAILIARYLWCVSPPEPLAVAPAPNPRAEEEAPPDPPAPSIPAAPEPVRLTSATAHADTESSFGALAGRVVSAESGLAVQNAEVSLLKEGALHAVTSAGDGSFHFEAPSAGHWELASVSAPGFAEFSPRLGQSPVMFEARPGVRIEDVVIYLSPLVSVTGRVVDEDEGPVAGAKVTARRGDLVGFDPTSAPVATSDRSGEFTLPVAGAALLVAEHPDYLGGSAWVDAEKAKRGPVTLTLMARAQGASRGLVTGTVVDAGNNPVEAALVTVEPSAHGGRHGAPMGGGAVLTDRAGAFAVSVLSAGPATYSVVATAKGYSEARANEVKADGPPLALKLGVGVSLVGHVVEAKAGRPVAAFSLFLSRGGRGGPGQSLSFLDGDGRYEVQGLAAGKVQVRVAAFGFAASKSAEVTLPRQGGPIVHDVALERGSRVRGRVVDSTSGRAISGARLTVEGDLASDDTPVPVQSVATTDDRGEFALAGVAQGLRTIIVAAVGYNKRLLSGLQAEADGDIGPLTIELTPASPGEAAKTELTGIGASLSSAKGGYSVMGVIDGGGAERVGLVPGDLIVAIDGTPAGSLDLGTAIEQIRGVEGSVVHLTVHRADGSEVELAVVRRRVLY